MAESTDNKPSTRAKIIQATLEVLAEEGFEKITVRKIAAKADVNIALISYHFSSKDGAVLEAMNFLSREFVDCFDILGDKTRLPEVRLRDFLERYADVAYRYPSVMRVFISTSGLMREADLYRYIRIEGFRRFRTVVEEIAPIADEKVLYVRFFQTMCAIAFPTLLADRMEGMTGIAYHDRQTRREYIEILLSGLLTSSHSAVLRENQTI